MPVHAKGTSFPPSLWLYAALAVTVIVSQLLTLPLQRTSTQLLATATTSRVNLITAGAICSARGVMAAHAGALVRGIARSFANCLKAAKPASPIDVALAAQQHESYVQLLRRLVPRVVEVAADDAYPDCVFIEDTAVVVFGAGAVIARPGAQVGRCLSVYVCSVADQHSSATVQVINQQLMHWQARHMQVQVVFVRSCCMHMTSRCSIVTSTHAPWQSYQLQPSPAHCRKEEGRRQPLQQHLQRRGSLCCTTSRCVCNPMPAKHDAKV